MDQTDNSSKSSEIVTGNERTPSGWGQSIKRFVFICLYVAFLIIIVIGVLVGLEYYAYRRVAASPVGQAYKDRDMDLARQSSQKVAPQYGYEPTPGFATIRNTRLGNSVPNT